MSSGSHLNYTKIWAKMIKRAIICSIDYRLAPKSRFPCQLEDVWQAYFWLVINCKDYFGFTPKRVIVVGDSAGGNLALSITSMAI
jgi:acetyl esterase/lipase